MELKSFGRVVGSAGSRVVHIRFDNWGDPNFIQPKKLKVDSKPQYINEPPVHAAWPEITGIDISDGFMAVLVFDFKALFSSRWGIFCWSFNGTVEASSGRSGAVLGLEG